MKFNWAVLGFVVLVTLSVGCGTRPGFSTGWSTNPDPALAGKEAALKAIKGLNGAKLGGLIFTVYYEPDSFVPLDPTKYQPDSKKELLAAAAIAKAADGTPSIGCRARSLTSDGTLLKNAVSVLAIGGDQIRVNAAAIPIQPQRGTTGKAVALSMRRLSDLRLIVLMSEMRLSFESSQKIRPDAFLTHLLHNIPRRTVVLGGNSMNDPSQSSTSPMGGTLSGMQFLNGKALSGHVVAMGLAGPIGVEANHGFDFQPCGQEVQVTDSRERWVVDINYKPAIGMYRMLRGMSTHDPFTSGWRHPIGIVTAPNEVYLRMIMNWTDRKGSDKSGTATGLPGGSLRFGSEIPRKTPIHIMRGGYDGAEIPASAKQCVAESLAKVKKSGATPALLLVSECCVRGMRMRTSDDGDKLCVVKDGILPAMGKTRFPIFGFYSFGAIGRIKGTFREMNHQFQQHTFLSVILSVR